MILYLQWYKTKQSWKSSHFTRQLPNSRLQIDGVQTGRKHPGGQDTSALTGDSDIILSLSLSDMFTVSLFCSCTIHLFWTPIVSTPVVLAASRSISVSYNDFSPMFLCPIITTAHLPLLHSVVSLSPNHIFTVCHSKQGVLKLLIIIPGHELVGRLGGGHIAAKVLQHTKWAGLTEPRPRGSGQPQKGKDNGKWRLSGRETRSQERLTCL